MLMGQAVETMGSFEAGCGDRQGPTEFRGWEEVWQPSPSSDSVQHTGQYMTSDVIFYPCLTHSRFEALKESIQLTTVHYMLSSRWLWCWERKKGPLACLVEGRHQGFTLCGRDCNSFPHYLLSS